MGVGACADDFSDEGMVARAGDYGLSVSDVVTLLVDEERLPAQREVVETDYGMQDGALKIPTRGKLVSYALNLLRINPRSELEDPTAQQIVVANREELEPWLFG